MIATFFVEIAMAFYIIARYKMTAAYRIITAILMLLAIFQVSEFGICEGMSLHKDVWAKIGFSAITLLPPLGLHLVYQLKNITLKKRKYLIYLPAFAWIGLFLFGNIMLSQGCSGNYVIFAIKRPFDLLYYIWYDALLVYAIARAWLQSRGTKNNRLRAAHASIIIGYLAFIMPSIAVRLLFEFSDKTASALPSIMCGFAVLFAGILTFRTAPMLSKKSR